MIAVPRLHVISDRQLCPLERFPSVARLAAEHGVGAVHIRERDLPDDEVVAVARRLRDALDGMNCRVIINSRPDLVGQARADGVHLPERGPSPSRVRETLPAGALVGVSVHSAEAAHKAEASGADYVIAGHVYETGSKPGLAGRGVEFIRDVSNAVNIPVIAIGGITPDNAREVIEAGAHGVAVLSAILTADDPGEVARKFANAIRSETDRTR